jgi:hypothetical protein
MLVESIATEPQPRCIRSGPRTRRTIRPDGSSDGSGCRSSSTVRTRADSPAARPAPTARQQRLDPSPFRIARPPLSSPPLQAEALNQPTLSTANSLSTEPGRLPPVGSSGVLAETTRHQKCLTNPEPFSDAAICRTLASPRRMSVRSVSPSGYSLPLPVTNHAL